MNTKTPKTPRSDFQRVEGLIGPYIGQLIDIPVEDARVAIADGWARDPFIERDDVVPYTTAEDIETVSAKAFTAATKLQQGETLVEEPPPEPEVDPDPEPEPEEDEDDGSGTGTRRKKTTKSMQAEDSGTGYKTRGRRG